MKIAFASDLHADFAQIRVDWSKVEADVLVIGGDSGNTIGTTVKTITKAAKHFRYVVFVDGNHEHYSNAPQRRTVEQTIDRIRAQVPENAFMLGHHQPHVEIDGVHFVGCNGWYSFDCVGDPIANRLMWRERMNDNRWIGFDEIPQAMPWDRAVDDAYLMWETIGAIKHDGKPIVALTHTAPHRDMVHWSATNIEWNASNALYVNSHMQRALDDHVGSITVWYNGHTHVRSERTINGVYHIANPRGYPRENPGWSPAVIDI